MVMEEYLEEGKFMDREKLFKTQFNCFFHDYEFYGSNLLNMNKANSFANKMYDNYRDVYFELNDDYSYCKEMVTGLKFIKVDSNETLIRYYNEETGLYILYIPLNEEKVNLRKMVNLLFNYDYITGVDNFFDYYRSINIADIQLVSNSHKLMLLKGKTITK